MDRRMRRRIHAGVVVAGLLPALALARGALVDALGANPAEALAHGTGAWGLRFLVASLAVTPLRRLLGLPALAPYRRSFGLLAFFYASLHIATYLALDLGFDFGSLYEDVAKRPYVTAGFAAYLLLVPLAATSTAAMRRRLGRRWIALHRLVYAATLCVVIHFLWLVKADLREPLVYAAVVVTLLAARLLRPHRPRAVAPSQRSRSAGGTSNRTTPGGGQIAYDGGAAGRGNDWVSIRSSSAPPNGRSGSRGNFARRPPP